MRNDTRLKFNAYLDRQAQLNGVSDATQQFTVADPVQQTLEDKIQASSQFLGLVNSIGVDDMKGQRVLLGINAPIASRTKVTDTDRSPTNVADLDNDDYECVSTEFDTALPWAQLDTWARFPDFQTRLRDQVLRRQALDRIMIGWRGTSVATPSTDTTHLSDVNKGWLQKYDDNASDYVSDSNNSFGKGTAAHYKNLDALVLDKYRSFIDEWHKDSPDLRVMISHDLLDDKYVPLVDQADPTEQAAGEIIVMQKLVGGLRAIAVPFMPSGTIVVTAPKNLSLYWQRGSRRRYVIDNPKRNRIEHYDSSNEAYVIEDYGMGCVIKNVTRDDEVN